MTNQWDKMICWFKKHPELLQRECDLLESNSNYHETFRVRSNLLLSAGEILVRAGGKTLKYPALLLYPEAYPYSLTKVFLLKTIPSEDQLKKLAELDSRHLAAEITENIKFYNYWHQNFDGSLCLLEADNLEKYGEFFSANDVINRTRDWLAGFETGSFPLESGEVELYGHFRYKDLKHEFLFPVGFYTNEVVKGELYLNLIASPYKGLVLEKKIYLGAVLTGKTDGGIDIPFGFGNPLQMMPDGISSPLEIIQKKDILANAIRSGEIIKCFWWSTENAIQPFSTISEFVDFIGGGDKEQGYQLIYEICKEEFYKEEKIIYWALRFRGQDKQYKFQAFLLNKVKEVSHLIIGDKSLETFKPLLDNYDIKAIKGEAFSEERFQLRNKGRTDKAHPKEKSISLLGCGSLGGEIGDCLAKAGIGSMNLVDFERMKYDNSVRHVVGIDMTGVFKVHALNEVLTNHNPFIKTVCLGVDLLASDFNTYFATGSIGVSTVADDNIECFINEQAVINNQTIFYARGLRGAKVGRIFRVTPGKDACFSCLSLYADEDDPRYIKIPIDRDLPTITNECNNPIRPASAADLKLIASLTSRIILDLLQKPDEIKNHWIWTTEPIDGIPISPYSLYSTQLPPHPTCPLCCPETKINVNMEDTILNSMRNEVSLNPNIETGGVLLGSIDSNNITIKYVSGPGPKAVKTPTEFLKDKEFCQKFIDEHYARHGENAVYVGEWHYHPFGSNLPSGTDIMSLSNIANGNGYLTDSPAMIILSNSGSASCTVHPARKSYYFVDITPKQ